MKTALRESVRLFCAFLVTFAAIACSDNGSNSNKSGSGGTGGGAGIDGAFTDGAGGDSNSGAGGVEDDSGVNGGADGGETVTCDTAKSLKLDLDSMYSKCSTDICAGGAHCVDNSSVPKGTGLEFGDCDNDSLCVPDPFIQYSFLFRPPVCRSILGWEGRCLSACLPEVEKLTSKFELPKDVCGKNELCSPCVDPIDGSDTGACSTKCDLGSSEFSPLQSCAPHGEGYCVLPEVTGAIANILDQNNCDHRYISLCLPRKFADPEFQPNTCKPIDSTEGRCMPNWIIWVADHDPALPQDTCESGELCAPCYDQTSGDETGVCRINGDKPSN